MEYSAIIIQITIAYKNPHAAGESTSAINMMGVTVVVLSTLIALCLGSDPLYKTKHYQVFSLEDAQRGPCNIKEYKEFQLETTGHLRTIVETPTNDSVPTDGGSPLFGDIWFSTTEKDGELLVRDTIVNQITDQNVYIFYNRSLPGYYVEDMIVYNVGRERGFGYLALIVHDLGYVEAHLVVAAYNTVRMFVEIYVRAE